MSNPIIRASWALVLFAFVANACNKTDVSADLLPEVSKPGSNLANISLEGRITDLSNTPLSGATVRSGTRITQTNIDGRFSFAELGVNPASTLIEVSKQGYFREFKAIEVQADTEQFTEIHLEKQSEVKAFAATESFSFSPGNGFRISLPENGFVEKANGSTYSALANMAAFAKNADDENFFNIIPGIRGYSLEKKNVTLSFISAVVAEITGTAGQFLQLAPGKTATILFPIPASQLANAPGSVSLWHFDTGSGLWTEEGSAFKEGNFYKGTVSHFSTWACGVSMPSSNLQGKVTDKSGNILSFARLQLYNQNGKIISTMVHTDNNGNIKFSAPGNMPMELRVLNQCREIIATRNINAGNGGASIGNLQSAQNSAATVTISGKVVNCKNQPVYNGYVNLLLDGQLTKSTINNGSFVVRVSRCHAGKSSASITAVDEESKQTSAAINLDVTQGIYETTVMSTCDKQNMQYISYTVNGTNMLMQAPNFSLVHEKASLNNLNTIYCYDTQANNQLAVTFSFSGSSTPGEYPVTALKISQNKTQFTSSGSFTVKITSYGEKGDYIEGSCSGKVKDLSSSNVLPFTFQFKVLRN